MDYMHELQDIEIQNPHLSKTGFKDWHPMADMGVHTEKWAAEYGKRAPLTAGDGLRQFVDAIARLRKFSIRKTVAPASSYVLKHRAEMEQGDYISNGCLIAAAIFLGIPVQHVFGTPNAKLGIGKRIVPG